MAKTLEVYSLELINEAIASSLQQLTITANEQSFFFMYIYSMYIFSFLIGERESMLSLSFASADNIDLGLNNS